MSVNSSLEISAQGMSVAAERLQTHASNIANINTPYYQRKIPVVLEGTQMDFGEILQSIRSDGIFRARISNSPGGVEMVGNAADSTPGKKVYEPGHPQADADGYVTYSNVDVLSDMADATVSQRLYEANLAVVGISKAMATRALEIGRGQ